MQAILPRMITPAPADITARRLLVAPRARGTSTQVGVPRGVSSSGFAGHFTAGPQASGRPGLSDCRGVLRGALVLAAAACLAVDGDDKPASVPENASRDSRRRGGRAKRQPAACRPFSDSHYEPGACHRPDGAEVDILVPVQPETEERGQEPHPPDGGKTQAEGHAMRRKQKAHAETEEREPQKHCRRLTIR